MAKQPHQVDIVVGKRIREARVRKGMSQDDLSNQIGVSFQQLQKYEKASNRVSASKLVEIAKALDIDPAYFLQKLNDEPQKTLPDEHVWQFTRQGRDLIDAFYKIRDNDLRLRIVRLVQQITERDDG